MNNLRISIYNLFSPKLKKTLGKSRLLKPFRDVFFRSKGGYRETFCKVKRAYLDFLVEFTFCGSIQVTSKAKQKGIENTILRHSINLLRKNTKRKDNDYIVFDVGANFGYLSLVWANSVSKQGSVFSFEPHPLLFKSFVKSISENDLNDCVFPEKVAVGNNLGEIEVNLLTTSSNVLNDASSQKNTTKHIVEMITLDNYIERNSMSRCDLLKIDVDGIELDILQGAMTMINKLKPILIIETNNDIRIIEFLKEYDYNILDMKLDSYKENATLPHNIFCIPVINQ